jgi:hypothetical protein
MQEARACAHPLASQPQDRYESSRIEFGSSFHTPFPTGYVDSSILSVQLLVEAMIVKSECEFDSYANQYLFIISLSKL